MKYLKNNWFKLALAVFVIFILFKKDISFRLRLNAPEEQPVKHSTPPEPVQNKEKEKEGAFTFIDPISNPAGNKTYIDKMNLGAIGSELWQKESAFSLFEKTPESDKLALIKRFSRVAISERKKYGIPSSVILANALLQSQAGNMEVTKKGNNYFAIQCSPDWQGESGKYDEVCFRHYENAWTSFRDHSLFLTSGQNEGLKNIDRKDYKGWAKAIEATGYSQEEKLAGKLIQIIEAYDLADFDNQ